MKKILWCSDNPLIPTGYAQVTRNILPRLRRAGYDAVSMAFQQFSMNMDEVKTPESWLGFPIRTAQTFGEQYGNKGSIDFWVNRDKPDITLFLLDSFMLNHMIKPQLRGRVIERSIDKLRNKTRCWMYFPFDSADVYPGSAELLETMHQRIAMSKFGQNLLKKETGMSSEYIPHGVDTLVFRPLPKGFVDKFKEKRGLKDKFIIGSVFRNQTRKMPTKLLKAYAKFAKDKDDVRLLMHCDPRDPHGQNLPDMISRKLDIEKEKVMFTGMNFLSGIGLNQLNMIYNIMDVHTLSTTGEGFGLPIIEAHAAGTPNVITDYTTSPELTNDGEFGKLVKVKGYIEGQMNTDRALIDTGHMAKCFNQYYRNRKLVKKHGELARKDVHRKYDWNVVLRKWLEVLDEKF